MIGNRLESSVGIVFTVFVVEKIPSHECGCRPGFTVMGEDSDIHSIRFEVTLGGHFTPWMPGNGNFRSAA